MNKDREDRIVLPEEELLKMFDDYIDETRSGCMDMLPSYILRTCDHRRYMNAFRDWIINNHEYLIDDSEENQ